MKQLSKPPYCFKEVLNKCLDGIKREKNKTDLLKATKTLIPMESQYLKLGKKGKLCKFPTFDDLDIDTSINPELNRERLASLYARNLRCMTKPAREVYNKIISSARRQRCPFCGGLGTPKNIDHFLPIAHFPQLSVLPLNLIPSCRDCNMGEKGDGYATELGKQILHPYLDKDIFYTQQWVFAQYLIDNISDPIEPAAIIYIAAPPLNNRWSLVDAQRAIKHFSDFDLANRYSDRASDHLPEIISQRNSFYNCNRRRLTRDELEKEFVKTFLTPVINSDLFENHWKKVMYRCLSKSRSFLQGRTVDVYTTT
ncbi:HNH endonuclease [Aeromonas veronii]|uniref:HNH endonuclease n=1 Tax=Aeromonas veronii TaxID=654 RepID=UPI0035B74298